MTAYFDHNIWVICGSVHQTDGGDVWYSSNGVDWHELMNPRFAPRHGASVTVYDNSLWLMCGVATNDSWRLRNVNAALHNTQPIADAKPLVWFPNPTGGKVSANKGFEAVSVCNAIGQQVAKSGPGHELDLGGLPSGIYFLTTHLPLGIETQKLIKY